MSIVLSYEELNEIKKLKCNGWKPTRNNLMLFDWTPEDLRKLRTGLGLTLEDVADFFDITAPTVSNWENGKVNNPMVLQMYGVFLERYYAIIKGYIPAYRKIGSNTFKFAEEL